MTEVAELYRSFGRLEARGRSAAYEALGEGVAGDRVITDFVAGLPPDKWQPQLLFAAARFLLGHPAELGELRELVRQSGPALAEVMLARRTQTNEPATLLVDRYSYDYAGYRLAGRDPAAPVLRCQPRGPLPLPGQVPAVAWRAGIDLNPLDVTHEEDARWLSCLVWPGEGDRAERLAAAIATARRDPPAVHRGNLATGVAALAATAPADATLVIYHTSVLYQVAAEQRAQFAATVRDLGAVWLSGEEPGLVPGTEGPTCDGLSYVIARDGRPAALADSHGAWLQWL